MQYTPPTPSDTGFSAPRFVITMYANQDGDVEVRSCELVGDTFRNRTSFQTRSGLDDVFCETVAEGLRFCLSKLTMGNEVLSLPEFAIEAPGLTLGSARVLVSKPADGIVSIIVRFKFFLGGIDRIFRSSVGFDSAMRYYNEEIATSVLVDITLPILNICNSVEMGDLDDAARIESFVQKLAERTHEMRFQTELLKRFIESKSRMKTMPDRLDPPVPERKSLAPPEASWA